MSDNAEPLPSTILRESIRRNAFTAPTSGCAAGFVQCNLVVLPESAANDFLAFCQANPRPCPLLAMSPAPGDPSLPQLGDNIDVRTDIPRYRRWVDGQLDGDLLSLSDVWRDDFVAFALGCSFSFEEALIAAGIDVRNVSEGVNVPMYRTNLTCQSAGPFAGNMVVSMRPMSTSDTIRTIQVCTRFPAVHGAPIHFGDPEALGISNIAQPDFGDAVTIKPGEMPVFWACGVTPQVALEHAALPLAFTHSPGHMLVTDKRNAELAVL